MTGKMFSVVTPIFPFFIVLSLLLYLISCPSCNKRCASTFFLPFCQPDLPKRSARLYNGANFYTFGGVTALFTGREISNRPACPYLYIIKTFANGFSETGEKRYACRKYLSRQVEPEKLELILEAGRVAPTGANRQPQRLVVVQSKEGMERLARCTRDFGAPTAVIVCADTSEAWTRKYDGKNISDIDASIVTDHMMLAAASLNLDTLWICMFKPEAVREEFALPANVEPVNILLIGYGDGPAADPNRHDTLRKPLSATVFHERF